MFICEMKILNSFVVEWRSMNLVSNLNACSLFFSSIAFSLVDFKAVFISLTSATPNKSPAVPSAAANPRKLNNRLNKMYCNTVITKYAIGFFQS